MRHVARHVRRLVLGRESVLNLLLQPTPPILPGKEKCSLLPSQAKLRTALWATWINQPVQGA